MGCFFSVYALGEIRVFDGRHYCTVSSIEWMHSDRPAIPLPYAWRLLFIFPGVRGWTIEVAQLVLYLKKTLPRFGRPRFC